MSFTFNHESLNHSGELLGGCDIIMELLQAGELKETIDEMRDRM